jgi:hypothetical protein
LSSAAAQVLQEARAEELQERLQAAIDLRQRVQETIELVDERRREIDGAVAVLSEVRDELDTRSEVLARLLELPDAVLLYLLTHRGTPAVCEATPR